MESALPDPPKPLFRDLDPEDDDIETTEIESLCVNCEENGMTRILLTKIPFFREVILMSFKCDQCGYSNNEIQPGARVQDKGVKVSVAIRTVQDLSRQVVKSDSATFKIPQLDFEVPADTQKGVLTTVEGVLERAIEGLQQDQAIRRIKNENLANEIDAFILKLKSLNNLEEPFTIVVEDPTGNSFVENLSAPQKDDAMEITYFVRTQEVDDSLGLARESSEGEHGNGDGLEEQFVEEVLTFPSNCSECSSPCVTNMKTVDIPHFKQVILMATICDRCGCRNNEVKSGSGIEELGTRYTLHVTDPTDMNRDVLKSDTCRLEVPEIEFELQTGTLGGKFTTLEGLFTAIATQLESSPFSIGDSSVGSVTGKMETFIGVLKQVASGEKLDIRVILDDPAGNSYLQNVYAPDPDPELTVEQYERSPEQNDELGLSDMVTENYS